MIIDIGNSTILIFLLVSTIIILLAHTRNLSSTIANSELRRQQQQENKRQLITAKMNAKNWARHRRNTKQQQQYAPVPIAIATNVKRRILLPHCVPFPSPTAPQFKENQH